MTAPGQVIGNYQLQTRLGSGGMGVVFQALDTRLQRTVAIKVMNDAVASQPELRERFKREAVAAAGLSHPNIIRIFESITDGPQLYMVMEYVQGGNLRQYLARMQQQNVVMHQDEALYIISQAALGLGHAHNAGMIHRDIKPDNVLLKPISSLGQGQMPYSVVITDFGLAKLIHAANVGQTALNQPVEALPYIAPEQFRGDTDKRSDIYALGVMIYEMLTGRPPFSPRSPGEAMQLHANQAIVPPRQHVPSLSENVEQFILRCLKKAPEARYESMEAVYQATQELRGLEFTNVPSAANPAASYAPPPPRPVVVSEPALRAKPVKADNEKFSEDTIVVLAPNGSKQKYPVRTNSIVVGRDPNIDIPVPGDKVSRRHARIDRRPDGTFTVTDLGSSNGTYYEGAKLIKDVPEPWPDRQELAIGEYILRLRKANITASDLNKTQMAGGDNNAPPNATAHGKPSGGGYKSELGLGVIGGTQVYDFADVADERGYEVDSSASSRSVGSDGRGSQNQQQESQTAKNRGPQNNSITVSLEPQRVQVEAGMVANAQVYVHNTGEIVKHCRLQLAGIDHEWVQTPSTTLQLLPDDGGEMPLIFRPPKSPNSSAREHLFEIRILDEKRNVIGYGQGILVIKPFYEFELEMEPELIQRRGLLQVSIYNKSNARDSYQLRGKDRENGLRFFMDPRPLVIDPLTQVQVEVEVRPKGRVLIGAAKQYQFQLEATTASGLEKERNGQLVSPPILPIWMMPLLMLLCVACVILALLLFLNRDQEPDEVAQEQPTPTATENLENFTEFLTATADSFTGSVIPGITATFEAIQDSDDDEDGLTYGEENEAGTDPDVADTDGDGLLDGEEVNVYETDPLSDDTDEDGLKDGEEVFDYETDPTDDDSDGDNLSDGFEVSHPSYELDPKSQDTDRDSFFDDEELEAGTDPTDRFSTPTPPPPE